MSREATKKKERKAMKREGNRKKKKLGVWWGMLFIPALVRCT